MFLVGFDSIFLIDGIFDLTFDRETRFGLSRYASINKIKYGRKIFRTIGYVDLDYDYDYDVLYIDIPNDISFSLFPTSPRKIYKPCKNKVYYIFRRTISSLILINVYIYMSLKNNEPSQKITRIARRRVENKQRYPCDSTRDG